MPLTMERLPASVVDLYNDDNMTVCNHSLYKTYRFVS